jgi:oligopeptidase B
MVPKPPRPPSLDWAIMSTEPLAEPPSAKQIPSQRTFHGDTVTDEYAWLASKDDPDTVDYLAAENAYADAVTAGLDSLRDQIFQEIKARTQESDLSVPVRKGGWWHYSRTVEGKQYAVYCRRAVAPGEVIPPMAADGQPLEGEEELLDGNELAVGHEFFSLGAFRLSPDQGRLAYSTDFSGNERYTIRIKDLTTGDTLPDEIPDTYAGCAWSRDGSVLFYVTADDAWRPYRIWRHQVGTPAGQDALVFEESDERFHVYVGLTRSERFLIINRQRADHRGAAAGRLDASRGVHHRGPAPAGRGLRRGGRRGPAAHPAQRRRGELRDRDRARHRPRGLDAAGPAPGGHQAARRGRVRGLHRRVLQA